VWVLIACHRTVRRLKTQAAARGKLWMRKLWSPATRRPGLPGERKLG